MVLNAWKCCLEYDLLQPSCYNVDHSIAYKWGLSARRQCALFLIIPTLVSTSVTSPTSVLAPTVFYLGPVPICSATALHLPVLPLMYCSILPNPITDRASVPHAPASRVCNMTCRYFYLSSVSLTRPAVINPDLIPVLAQWSKRLRLQILFLC